MKTFSIVALGLIAGLSAEGALVKFKLSPPGTDAAAGLSPSNQVLPATGSTGSGDEISSGIVFDTDSSVLQVAVGYGSAAGFANLTGPALAMHIHGPALAGTNANVLVSLIPYNFPASNPTNGGVIYGNVLWPTNLTADLLGGLTYLNIHTALFPGGEIRGQLIPINEAPVVVCAPAAAVECGTPAVEVVLLSDPEGDALTVAWSLNGVPIETNTVPARAAGLPAMDVFSQVLPPGTNLLAVAVTDTAGNTVSCASTVVVADTTPPAIVSASASPDVLWPPNHKWVNITVRADVTDTCSATSWKILSVASNQPVNGKGDGNTASDWTITGGHTVKLRAERSGTADRIYSLTLQAKDAAGNLSATRVVTVKVPKSQSGK